jgi:hypothetical protein
MVALLAYTPLQYLFYAVIGLIVVIVLVKLGVTEAFFGKFGVKIGKRDAYWFDYSAELAKLEAQKLTIPFVMKEKARDKTREFAEAVNNALSVEHIRLVKLNDYTSKIAPNTVDLDFEHLLDGKIWKYLVTFGMTIQEKNGLPEMTDREFHDREEVNYDRFISGLKNILSRRWTCQHYPVEQYVGTESMQGAIDERREWLREQLDELHEQYRYIGLQKENEIRKIDTKVNQLVAFVKKNRCMPGLEGCNDKKE